MCFSFHFLFYHPFFFVFLFVCVESLRRGKESIRAHRYFFFYSKQLMVLFFFCIKQLINVLTKLVRHVCVCVCACARTKEGDIFRLWASFFQNVTQELRHAHRWLKKNDNQRQLLVFSLCSIFSVFATHIIFVFFSFWREERDLIRRSI